MRLPSGINASDAYAYFTQRVGAMAKSQGRRVVQWCENRSFFSQLYYLNATFLPTQARDKPR
eukprot:COSAG06_NODE_10342_length_1698_cov_1.800500_4_plen_61_part_01